MAKNNQTLNTTPATDLAVAKPANLTPTERTRNFLAEVFNPLNCPTLADREALIAASIGTQDGLNLASYRTIYDIYMSGDWREKCDSKGENYTSFDKYCGDMFGLRHAQVENAKKTGKLIRPDGQGTILRHKSTKNDFNFTQLVALMECNELFDCTYGKPDKNGKRKVETREHKPAYFMVKSYDSYGNQIWLNGDKEIYGGAILKAGGKDYEPATDKNGERIPCTVLEMLCDMDMITPATGAKSFKKVIADIFGKVTDITTDEPVTDEPVTDEPVTDEPVTDESVTDEPVTDEPATVTLSLSPKAYELLINLVDKGAYGYDPCDELDEIVEKLGLHY